MTHIVYIHCRKHHNLYKSFWTENLHSYQPSNKHCPTVRYCNIEDAAAYTYVHIYIQWCCSYHMQRSIACYTIMWAVSIDQCVPCTYIASNGIYYQCMCTVYVSVCCMCEAVPPQSLLHVRFSVSVLWSHVPVTVIIPCSLWLPTR